MVKKIVLMALVSISANAISSAEREEIELLKYAIDQGNYSSSIPCSDGESFPVSTDEFEYQQKILYKELKKQRVW